MHKLCSLQDEKNRTCQEQTLNNSIKHRIQNSIQHLLPPPPPPTHKRINHRPRSRLILPTTTHLKPLLLPPHLLRPLSSLPNRIPLILVPIQIAPLTLTTPPTCRPEMLAKVRVPFLARDLPPADVAHRVPAVADELVAAGRFDEREVAFRAGALDGGRGGGFNRGAQRGLFRFEAGVRVAPYGEAAAAGGFAAVGGEAFKFEAAAAFVDARPGLLGDVGGGWEQIGKEIEE